MPNALPTPTQARIEASGVEVVDKAGRSRLIGGDKLRVLSAETIAAIANKFGGETIANMLIELCDAKCITKGGHEIADNRTRLAALSLTMAYLIGRPVERQEILTVNVDADAEAGLAERLKNSPALREVFRKMLDEIDGAGAIEA